MTATAGQCQRRRSPRRGQQSSLDAENERLLRAALDPLMKDRTTIIIAHRPATVLKTDRIVVTTEGRNVEALPA